MEGANGTLARIEGLLREIADLATDVREIRAWTVSHEREDRQWQTSVRETLQWVKAREETHWETLDSRVKGVESEVRTHRYAGIAGGAIMAIVQALGIQLPRQ